ncbi:hypothetical protein LZ906_006830 [Paraclostridium ghonii]|uniref:hypothetical protein n=1 Tax=Paraclostridium ghonii TaxID=29358 RepID=UPI00202CF1E1|nr:hypothetical protein [Paeniclostridium ghonii]MCM0165931.1 hypothetical protein [Paeniclostridium ghonii]
MDKRKLKKWGIIFCVICVLWVIGTISEKNDKSVEADAPSTEETVAKETKKPSMTKDELMNKLDMYEKLYSNHLGGIAKIAEKNNDLELQKSLASTRDIADSAYSKIFKIQREYDSSSNEYKALDELSVVFNSLESACNNGIKYIDKGEFKYFEKYEDNLKRSDLFMQRYSEAKEKLK